MDLDEFEESEVRHRLARGDYHDPSEIAVVNKWLTQKQKERKFLEDCQRASISAALDASKSANRANLIAATALVVSVIAAHQQIAELARLFSKLVQS